jgi:hypothetical protein
MLDRWFIEGVKRGDEVFWVTEIGGHIMKLNVNSLQTEYVIVDGIKDDMKSSAFACEDNEILYIIADHGKKLVMLSKDNKLLKSIELGFEEKYLNMYSFVGKYGDELIIVPRCDNEIIRVNIKTDAVYTDNIISNLEKEADKEIKAVYAKCDIVENGKLYIFPIDTMEMIQYDLKTGKKTYRKLPELIGRPLNVIRYETSFYILNDEGCVCSWDDVSEKCEKIFDNPKGETKVNDFSLIYAFANRLWIMPGYEDDIYTMDISKREIECFNSYPEKFDYSAPKTMGKYTARIEDENKCYFTMHAGNYIFYIDKKSGEGKWLETKWPTEKETLTYILTKGVTVVKEKEVTLDTFIKYIEQKNEKGKED